ncbi:MAG: 3-dehydroquinate synthase [Parachlamydiaceae bacterium]
METFYETTPPEQCTSLHKLLQTSNYKPFVIADRNIPLKTSLSFPHQLIPGGEEAKTLRNAESLYETLDRQQLDRDSLLIGLGGGTISDLTGFLAATYLRGIALALIPTTLLGMVDASIGGKNGLNLGAKKNAIGTIFHPKHLIINPLWLRTLSPSEYRQGLAEVVKYGVIEGEDFVTFLEENAQSIKNQDTKIMLDLIKWCVSIKTRIVEESQARPEVRDLLNFGHTFGHAIESASDFSIPHGDAIAIGMNLAMKASSMMGGIDKKSAARIKRILEGFGLPVEMPGIEREKILYWMKKDKKNRFGKIYLILAEKIGKVSKSPELPLEEVEKIFL